MELQELLENARHNEMLLKRLQQFELKLLSCQDWTDLLNTLLTELPEQFRIDAVSFKLYDPDGLLKASIEQSLALEYGALLAQIEFFKQPYAPELGVIKPPSPWVSGLSLPLQRNGQNLGQLCLYSSRVQRFSANLATDFIQHLAAVVAACLVLVRHSEERLNLALTDPLTVVENRRGFERSFQREWARGLRHYHEFALVLLDIDFFKQVNDTYGHGTGDRVLRQLCDTLKQTLRPTDHIGRLGGEEFVLLMTDCDHTQLATVVDRVQKAVRDMPILTDLGEVIHITVSGSYFTLVPRQHSQINLTQVLKHLDDYLYRAKQRGRNCFIYAGE